MPLYLWIAFGSALGGTARFALSGLVAERIGETFPWGTLVVNVSGSFAIGLFATVPPDPIRHHAHAPSSARHDPAASCPMAAETSLQTASPLKAILTS